MTEPKLLHIYAQYDHYDSAHIVGNRVGLEALKDAIIVALDTPDQRTRPRGVSEIVAPSDDREYNIHVRLDDSPLKGPTWSRWAVPYTADSARENREDAIYP